MKMLQLSFESRLFNFNRITPTSNKKILSTGFQKYLSNIDKK